MTGVTVPKGFEHLLGREYWDQASKDHLWAWIEAIATSRCECFSLGKAIEICGNDILLLEDNPRLERNRDPGKAYVDWAEIFKQQDQKMRDQNTLTYADNFRLMSWCIRRLEEIEKADSAA